MGYGQIESLGMCRTQRECQLSTFVPIHWKNWLRNRLLQILAVSHDSLVLLLLFQCSSSIYSVLCEASLEENLAAHILAFGRLLFA